MTVFLDELMRSFDILPYPKIHTDCPIYLKRGSQGSATNGLKDNTISAMILEFSPKHMSSTVNELYKIGGIFLSILFRWTPELRLIVPLFCSTLSRSSR